MEITRRYTLIALSVIVSQNRLNPTMQKANLFTTMDLSSNNRKISTLYHGYFALDIGISLHSYTQP